MWAVTAGRSLNSSLDSETKNIVGTHKPDDQPSVNHVNLVCPVRVFLCLHPGGGERALIGCVALAHPCSRRQVEVTRSRERGFSRSRDHMDFDIRWSAVVFPVCPMHFWTVERRSWLRFHSLARSFYVAPPVDSTEYVNICTMKSKFCCPFQRFRFNICKTNDIPSSHGCL